MTDVIYARVVINTMESIRSAYAQKKRVILIRGEGNCSDSEHGNPNQNKKERNITRNITMASVKVVSLPGTAGDEVISTFGRVNKTKKNPPRNKGTSVGGDMFVGHNGAFKTQRERERESERELGRAKSGTDATEHPSRNYKRICFINLCKLLSSKNTLGKGQQVVVRS